MSAARDIGAVASYMLAMNRFALALVLTVAATAPANLAAQDADPGVEEGFSLLERGARLILRSLVDEMQPTLDEAQKGLAEAIAEWEPAMRALAESVGDLGAYHPPEVQPNGDILIRRKTPLPPTPPTDPIGPDGETEL